MTKDVKFLWNFHVFFHSKKDRQIILYRLNKIILMRWLKHFCVFFFFKVHPDTSLIEFKTTHFVEKRKTYNFAQIQRKISILAPKWLSNYSLQIE